jgi:hypothetical protein
MPASTLGRFDDATRLDVDLRVTGVPALLIDPGYHAASGGV